MALGFDTPPTVEGAVELVRSKQCSARELVSASLEAIERLDPLLNAFSHVDADGALQAADEIDKAVARGDALGPLAGVPFAVKDLEHCAGMPTTRGSRWFLGEAPQPRDDLHVGRLRDAGAIPIGKTTTPEFGAFAYTSSPALGTSRNPWDLARTPGGSSGGSAAAVASAIVPFATASDGGGSIRTPAAFCGLPGLKPCYGRIPAVGVTQLSQNAVVGSLSTTISDTALLLDVMAGPHRRDRTCLPPPDVRYREVIDVLDVRGLRVAWSADLGFAVVEAEVIALCHQAMSDLIEVAALERVSCEVVLDDYLATYARVEGADMWVDIPDGLYPERADELDPLVRPGWDRAALATLPKFAAVYNDRRRIEEQIADVFEDIDVLVTPTTAMPAFAAEGPMPTTVAGQTTHAGMSVPFGMLANLCNLPSITLPAGRTTEGLPVGLLVTGDRHREDVCLRLGRLFEQARPWPRHAPDLA